MLRKVYLCVIFEWKMDERERIEHAGIVERIAGGRVEVRILQASACSSCSARGLCRSSESKEKIVDAIGHYPSLRVGDKVTIAGAARLGLRASLLAYCLPLVLMVVALFLGVRISGEVAGALMSLAVLVLYFGVLRFFRHKLAREFEFRIVPDTPTETCAR